MTEAIDAATLHAQRHLISMMARGMDADSICADMAHLGWPHAVVLNTVHAMLEGVMIGPKLTPTERALFILAGSAVEDPSTPGGFRLRGRPSTALGVISAANIVLNNFSCPLIDYPGIDRGAA